MVAALAAWAVGASTQAATVAVSADRLLDVATGRYVERPLVVITDGRIVSVGRQGDAAPAGAERVDLPGVTLLPGLIDMHVHLTSSPLYGGYTGYQFSDAFWGAIGVRHAKDTQIRRLYNPRDRQSAYRHLRQRQVCRYSCKHAQNVRKTRLKVFLHQECQPVNKVSES